MRVLFLAAALFAAPAAAQPTETTPPRPPVAPPAATPDNLLFLDLSNGGRVIVQLRPDVAPGHVARVKTLAQRGFYDGLAFHRVIPGFMAQGGDPKGDGTGGSELPDIPAEFNDLPHVRGAVAMARSQDPNSANSQFYIMFAPRLSLDRNYTVFGRVVGGMNAVDAIEKGEPPAQPTRILKATVGAPATPTPPAPTAPQPTN